MACTEIVAQFPPDPTSTKTYEEQVSSNSSQQGQLCAVANYQACGPQCSDMSKNYPGCASCLSSPISCPVSVADPNVQQACCPLLGPAVACSNCLGLYDSDALNKCLYPGLSEAAIIGISVGVIAALIIIAVLIYVFVIRQQRQAEARQKLGLGENSQLGNVNYIELQKLYGVYDE